MLCGDISHLSATGKLLKVKHGDSTKRVRYLGFRFHGDTNDTREIIHLDLQIPFKAFAKYHGYTNVDMCESGCAILNNTYTDSACFTSQKHSLRTCGPK
jgi:predicted aldo/keto reductase-like oxidoreductase